MAFRWIHSSSLLLTHCALGVLDFAVRQWLHGDHRVHEDGNEHQRNEEHPAELQVIVGPGASHELKVVAEFADAVNPLDCHDLQRSQDKHDEAAAEKVNQIQNKLTSLKRNLK